MREPSGEIAETEAAGPLSYSAVLLKLNAERTLRCATSMPTTRPKRGLTAQSVLRFGDSSIAQVVVALQSPDPGRSMQRAAEVFRSSFCTIAPPLPPT